MPQRARIPQKKLRGIPRRLRALRKWANDIRDGGFPLQHEIEENSYWNWKIPTHWLLVEGKQSTQAMKNEIVEMMLGACAGLIQAKPDWASSYRVTCWICVPNMHSSEICIFRDEPYFRSKVDECRDETGFQSKIAGRSLSSEWGFAVPPGLSELGVRWEYACDTDGWGAYCSDHWMYGEVDG